MQDKVRSEPLQWYRQLTAVLFVLVSVWYLWWRLGTFNPDAFVFSILLYAAEVFGLLTVLLHLFMVWRLTQREAPPPPPGLRVDVLIPTLNEPVAMLRHTLLAAMKMRYPHQTWLLDDGNRPEMAALAAELGVRYLARQERTHAKAGNLNHALQYCDGDFVAIFDADHAPAETFLERTLGYFADPEVAFVQTPQEFYNLDSFQHRLVRRGRVWTEQALFFRIIQRGKDYWNAAFFCGSCALLRRSALQQVGGLATGTITEDLHTSLRLHKAGYRSVYHAEALAYGIAPANVVPFLKQRLRWGQGAMQVWRMEGIVLFCRGLSLPQRLCYLASVLTYFEGWQKGFFYLAPAWVLLSGQLPILAGSREFFLHFVPFFTLTILAFEEISRGYGNFLLIEQYNFARFATFCWSTLGWLRRRLPFIVTTKDGSGGGNSMRMLLPQLLVVALTVLAIPVGVILFLTRQHLPLDGFLVNLVWAGFNLWLGLSLTLFSWWRAHFRRQDYRFPLPLPVVLQSRRGQEVLATADEVSSSGLCLQLQDGCGLSVGDEVSGSLHLPQATLPVCLQVVAVRQGGTALSCRFGQLPHGVQDQLDAFLYGSGLQWQLRHLSERARTPLQCLLGKRERRSGELLQWRAVRFRPLHTQSVPALGVLASHDGVCRALLTFSALPSTRLELSATARDVAPPLIVDSAVQRQLQACSVPLFWTELSPPGADQPRAQGTSVGWQAGRGLAC